MHVMLVMQPPVSSSRRLRCRRALGITLAPVAWLALSAFSRPGPATVAPTCRAATVAHPDSVLTRAISAMGLDKLHGLVRTWPVTDLSSDLFQSDRMYAPIPYRSSTTRIVTDWESGFERMEIGGAASGAGYVSDATRAVLVPPGAGHPTAIPATADPIAAQRAIDVWMVLADWKRGGPVASHQECYYRDYWRTVLTRTNAGGVEERLFVDTKSGFPVKLERREPHYLFGDVLTEYLWTVWLKVGETSAPVYSYRIQDGETETIRRSTSYALVPRDSVAPLEIPANPTPLPANNPVAQDPDTVRVSANTFLLTTRAYSNTVTLQRDTVFILDAQTNEARARADSVWIGKLFPGRHPLVLVVTDLAWPHIAGVRYWAAVGVPIITHRASKEFLARVIAHPWTLKPDLLEQRRGKTKIAIRAIDGPLDLARGAVQLRPIDGAGSEGALMAYVPSERYLYAGDYIQQGSIRPLGPGMMKFTYADEVAAAVRRSGFSPERFAAMHVGLTPWSIIVPNPAMH